MNIILTCYGIYVVASVVLTVWVGRTLHKNGRVFLVDAFRGNQVMADSVNHLLLVGFYLINFGYMSLALRFGEKPTDAVEAVEFLSMKLGLVVAVLGAMHFFNMANLDKIRHKAKNRPADGMHQADPILGDRL